MWTSKEKQIKCKKKEKIRENWFDLAVVSVHAQFLSLHAFGFWWFWYYWCLYKYSESSSSKTLFTIGKIKMQEHSIYLNLVSHQNCPFYFWKVSIYWWLIFVWLAVWTFVLLECKCIWKCRKIASGWLLSFLFIIASCSFSLSLLFVETSECIENSSAAEVHWNGCYSFHLLVCFSYFCSAFCHKGHWWLICHSSSVHLTFPV